MSKDDDEVLATAKKRLEYAIERDSHNRDKAKADLRFLAASPDDPWQWDERDLNARKLAGRVALTINKMPQHIRQVTNDIRQNRPSIKYRPADSRADVKTADILMGIARHIEANSDADVAYDNAADGMVAHGTGYVRVLADWVNDSAFEQDIFIRAIADPFRCWDDPDAIDPAGADRKWFFIEELVGEDEYKAEFPKAEPVDWEFDSDLGWFSRGDKKIRVAEYFEVCERDKKLFLWANGASSFEGDKLPVGVFAGEVPQRERKAKQRYVMWRKLSGKEILEEKEFPCKWIPVSRAWGNHYAVDGKVYVSGLVRNSKDSQRMYNVAQSAIVERVMQSPKAPWVAPVDAISGYEKTWQTANTGSHAFLPYNHKDDADQPIPPPVRNQPSQIEPGLMQIAQGSADDIKSETGQYDASLGQRSNETSGKAIMARQREGDTATYHYIDNLARMVRHVGRIVLDMIPRVLDTRRVARILGEDGAAANATLDPSLPQSYHEYRDDENALQRVFNPMVGTYDVYTTTGPSFTTRRQEAVEAMTTMTQANPELWRVIGDKLVQAMDWPGAEEMAKRLKSVLLPEVAQSDSEEGEQMPPEAMAQIQQMQQQMEQMQQAGAALQQELMVAEQAKDSEAAGRIKAEIKAQEAQALLRIAQAEDSMMDAVRAAQESAQAQAMPQPAQEQPGEQATQMIAPLVLQTVADAVQRTSQAVEAMAMGQQQLAAGLQEQSALMAEALRPRQSTVHIQKQPDGSFVGQKVEQ